MLYHRLKPDSMQMQITCAHCERPKADMKLSHMWYGSYVPRVQYNHNLIQYKNQIQYDSFATHALPFLTDFEC